MTTTTGDAEESQQELKQSFIDWVKDWFRADGRLARAVQDMEDVIPKLRGMLSQHGPKDYEESDDDIAYRVERIISRKYRPSITYSNGDSRPPNGEKRLLNWILGIVSGLAVIVVAASVTLYGEFTALKATVTTGMNAHEQRINRLEAERDQRYRAQPGSP